MPYMNLACRQSTVNAVKEHFSVRTIHSTVLTPLLSLRHLRQPDIEPEVLPFYANRAVGR
jgi:hypothetical protein